jgi:hypothetical protein
MRIRAGYEISYDCPQPTPMILVLSVHPSRMSDLISWDRLQIDPPIPANTYHDSFGNFCHVIRAPAGRLTLSTDFLVQDSGELDEVVPGAEQHPLEELPVDTLIFLLGSRYCETDRLLDTAWSLFGLLPPVRAALARTLAELDARQGSNPAACASENRDISPSCGRRYADLDDVGQGCSARSSAPAMRGHCCRRRPPARPGTTRW